MSTLHHRVIVTALGLILAACSNRYGSATSAQQQAIGEAGQRLNVPVRTSNAAYAKHNGSSVLTAAAMNLEQIPATELRHGIDLGIAYIDAPAMQLPRDYRVRATADVSQPGRTTGIVALIDQSGRTAAEVPASIDVWSMTVPPDARTASTRIALRQNRENCDGVWTCYRCTNGQTICYCAGLAPRASTL
jgi:hypothetical protein